YPEKALQKYRQSLKTTLEGPGNKSLGLVKLKMRLEQHASLREDFQELNNLVGYSLNAISGKKQDQFGKLDYLSSNEAEGIFVAEELLGGINKLIDKSYQDLTEFPYELFEDPDKIISLDLSHNHISKLPPELGQLSNLEYLNLNDNPGLYIYDVDWARLENLRELKLNRLDLVEVPPVLFYCPQLEKLELYRNQLTHIPEIEGANYSLRHLDLSHNQLGYLPSWMYHLSGLEYLYLEDNRLEALSEEIYGLSNLKVLHLKDNALRQLPESIKALTALQSNNQGKYFQNGFTIEGNAFDFKLPKELLNDDPEKIIDFILAQQVEVIGEVEDKRSKSKETEEIIEEEEPKPVIFLAYANQIDHRRHLRNLAQEMRDVRKSLSPVVRTGSVEIVERVDATIDDIVDVFQDPLYSGRIAIFHYGGHA
ncbi:MAG: leucine-rich repeat domain-containing protein, partial [Bacteroidetes bacterium]|nr:leucine-rich repeat domain-containing protein [Bacteroidota bacterium]